MAALRALLPQPTIPEAEMHDEAEEVMIEDFQPNTNRGHSAAYDDSDDDGAHGGGQRVQCANQ